MCSVRSRTFRHVVEAMSIIYYNILYVTKLILLTKHGESLSSANTKLEIFLSDHFEVALHSKPSIVFSLPEAH